MATATQAPEAPKVITAQTIAAMTPDQRMAYYQTLSEDEQARAEADYHDYRVSMNHDYMSGCVEKEAVCPPLGSAGGVSANYTLGSSLWFEIPTAQGAFAKELIFAVSVTMNLAAGTGALYALSNSAPYSLIDTIEVLYNGELHRLRPVFLKYLEIIKGNMRNSPATIVAGNSDANYQSTFQSTLGVTAGAQTWTFQFRVPLAALHEGMPYGMVPIMGQSTKMQVKVNLPAGLMGNDGLTFPIYANGGTGNGVTVTSGTVTCKVVYFDGENFEGPEKKVLDIHGDPTVQYIIDQPLNNLTAGNAQRQRITSLMRHHVVLAIVIDGQNPGKYCATSNIQELALVKDAVGLNPLMKYGTGTNVPVTDFFWRFRKTFGQDLPDEGVIPFIVSWGYNQTDASNKEGLQVLNMTSGGWTDIHHEVTVGAVSTANNITPRVELMLLSLNPDGLKQA